MIRLVVANQKGGVAKTTTTINMAKCFADLNLRVLIIDADSQGSVAIALGLKPESFVYDFLIRQYKLSACVVKAAENIDVLNGSRETTEAEQMLIPRPGRELTLKTALEPVEDQYDVVLIDCAPSITLLQSCAMMYAEQILIPLTMDPLSLQGAFAAINSSKTLNMLFKANIRPVALLPVQVDNRLQMTELVLNSLSSIADEYGVQILPRIRTDATVTKAVRAKTFLVDYDPKGKAAQDYRDAATELLKQLKGQLNGKQLALPA